jgi:hypothetical protein
MPCRHSGATIELVAEAQAKGDYFGTFLDAMESQSQGPGEPSDALARILKLLADKGRTPILELASASGLTLTDFTAELDAARTNGFVEVAGAPPNEQASLTAAGKELAAHIERL